MVVSLFLFLLAGKLIQYQMVNYFVAVSGKLIHNHVVKKFIDIYKRTKKLDKSNFIMYYYGNRVY